MLKRPLPFLVVLLTLALPASAAADAFTTVENAYKRTGTINACQFSAATLSQALRQEDTYATQYFNDFATAVQGALNTRAGGACRAGGGTHLPSGAAALIGGAPPGSVTATTGAGPPAPLLLLAGFAALLALLGGVYGIARAGAWDIPGAADWRQAWAEASYRLSLRWSDLADRRRR
jgi:hypothetical protein